MRKQVENMFWCTVYPWSGAPKSIYFFLHWIKEIINKATNYYNGRGILLGPKHNILKSRSYMTNGKNVARDFMIQIVYCPLQFVTPIILFLILETNNFFCTFFFFFWGNEIHCLTRQILSEVKRWKNIQEKYYYIIAYFFYA